MQRLPSDVPIRTAGPSLPRGNPPKKLIMLPKRVPKRVLSGLNESIPRRIPSLLGIPPPLTSGIVLCMRIISPASAKSAANTRMINNGELLASEYRNMESAESFEAIILKKNIKAPERAPQSAPKKMQGAKLDILL